MKKPEKTDASEKEKIVKDLSQMSKKEKLKVIASIHHIIYCLYIIGPKIAS